MDMTGRVRQLELNEATYAQVLVGLSGKMDESLKLLKALPCAVHDTRLTVLERNGFHNTQQKKRLWDYAGDIGTGVTMILIAAMLAGFIG